MNFSDFKYQIKSGLHQSVAPVAGLIGRRSRKKRRVVDAFLFYNELELLEIRLAYLYDQVDRFVIAECAQTFSGSPKRLFFDENKEQFKQFADKIHHLVIPNPGPSGWVSNPSNPSATTSEFYQRDYLIHGIIGCDDDVVLVSDVDEIISPSGILQAVGFLSLGHPAVIFRQKWFVLFMNALVYESYRDGMDHPFLWFGPVATTFGNFKKLYQSRANNLWIFRWGQASRCVVRIHHGGYHFSFMGGVRRIFEKLKSEANRHLDSNDLADLRKREFLGKRFRLTECSEQFPPNLARLIAASSLPLLSESEYAKLLEQFALNLSGGGP